MKKIDSQILKVGDLVKNKASASWRDQEALGFVLEVVDEKTRTPKRIKKGLITQLVKVKWISPSSIKSREHIYYGSSVELVAGGK